MSSWFDHILDIEIMMKNHSKIKTAIMWDDRDNGALENVSGVDNISCGKELLRSIMEWYDCYEYYGDGSDFLRLGCDNEEKILNIKDFSGVEKILLKEKTTTDLGAGSLRNQLIISSDNNRHITDAPLFSEKELLSMKQNIPESVQSIGKDAFKGCDEFVFYVKAGSYAAKYAEREGLPYIVLPGNDKQPEERKKPLLPMHEKIIIGPTIKGSSIIEANAEKILDGTMNISVLRVITVDRIYVFKITDSDFIVDSADFFSIENGRLFDCNNRNITTVPLLADALLQIAAEPEESVSTSEERARVAETLVNDASSLKDILVVEAGMLDLYGEWGDKEELAYITPFDIDCEVDQEKLLSVCEEEKLYIDFTELN